jgi:hypothetical protein
MSRVRPKRRCKVVSSPERREVIAAYGREGGFRTHISVALRAFVFSFYRWMLFKPFRSVEPPCVTCIGIEKQLLLGFWAILIAIVILLLGGSFITLGIWIFVMLGLSLIIFLSDRDSARAMARTRLNQCRSCEYDLFGLASLGTIEEGSTRYDIGCDKCPECGAEYPRIRP